MLPLRKGGASYRRPYRCACRRGACAPTTGLLSGDRPRKPGCNDRPNWYSASVKRLPVRSPRSGSCGNGRRLTPLHIRTVKQYRTAQTREDNLSPNAGFMEEYPLWVVFLRGVTQPLAMRLFQLSSPPSARAAKAGEVARRLAGGYPRGTRKKAGICYAYWRANNKRKKRRC